MTGDNPVVAETVCHTLGLASAGTLTGSDLDTLDDEALTDAVTHATIFARVSPEQKARILRAQRRAGSAVAFLGDGVNDALALHHADVGISVDSATDVAKDAADIILLERDLDVLADGVAEGRRIFANTIKYVLMGTSSNFGNMFSVTVAAAFLPFLPMLPVADPAQQPALRLQPDDHPHRSRRRRAAGPAIALGHRVHPPLHDPVRPAQLAVRLRDLRRHALGIPRRRAAVPFRLVRGIARHPDPHRVRHPYPPGPVPPQPPVAAPAHLGDRRRAGRHRSSRRARWREPLGFAPLPVTFFAVLVAFVVTYLVCVEIAKYFFFKVHAITGPRPLSRGRSHQIHRIAARWSHHEALPPQSPWMG